MTLLKGLAFSGCREDLANGTQYNRVLYPFSLQPSLPPPKNFIAGKGKDSGYGHRWGTEKLKGAMLEVGGECPGPPIRRDCSLQIRVSNLTQCSAVFSQRDARWRCGTAMGTQAGPRGLPGGSALGTLPGQASAGLLAPSSKFVIFPRDKEHPFTCCLILPSPLAWRSTDLTLPSA